MGSPQCLWPAYMSLGCSLFPSARKHFIASLPASFLPHTLAEASLSHFPELSTLPSSLPGLPGLSLSSACLPCGHSSWPGSSLKPTSPSIPIPIHLLRTLLSTQPFSLQFYQHTNSLSKKAKQLFLDLLLTAKASFSHKKTFWKCFLESPSQSSFSQLPVIELSTPSCHWNGSIKVINDLPLAKSIHLLH